MSTKKTKTKIKIKIKMGDIFKMFEIESKLEKMYEETGKTIDEVEIKDVLKLGLETGFLDKEDIKKETGKTVDEIYGMESKDLEKLFLSDEDGDRVAERLFLSDEDKLVENKFKVLLQELRKSLSMYKLIIGQMGRLVPEEYKEKEFIQQYKKLKELRDMNIRQINKLEINLNELENFLEEEELKNEFLSIKKDILNSYVY